LYDYCEHWEVLCSSVQKVVCSSSWDQATRMSTGKSTGHRRHWSTTGVLQNATYREGTTALVGPSRPSRRPNEHGLSAPTHSTFNFQLQAFTLSGLVTSLAYTWSPESNGVEKSRRLHCAAYNIRNLVPTTTLRVAIPIDTLLDRRSFCCPLPDA